MDLFLEDLNIFYLTIYGGIAVGLLFDFYRILRRNFKIVDYLSFIFDIVFWIAITVTVFVIINVIEKFDLRYYHFVALFLGFILYYNTVSKYILTFFNKIVSFFTHLCKRTVHYIVSFLNNLYYIIIYSIHLMFDIICYIPSVFYSNKRKRKNKKGVKI